VANVSVRQLDVTYGVVPVLLGLNIEVNKGEFIVLLGPSGCGKSTLLNAIAGLVDASGGQIWIGDKNVTWEEPSERGIGMVFQSYALYPQMTARGNLSFGLRMAGVAKPEIEARVNRAADMLRIRDLLDRRPSQLSGGQRQRVAIGRALVREVEVFLFDEPLSNLDAKLRADLRVELKQLHEELGSTMIFVTHDQIEALTLADRIAVMHQGVIQQLAAPREIYRRPANRYVAGFVGSPTMNFLSGRLSVKEKSAAIRLDDGRDLDLGKQYEFIGPPPDGGMVDLGIRPESFLTSGDGRGLPSLPFTVSIMEPMGATSVIWGTVHGQRFSVVVDADREFQKGQSLDLHFNPRDISLFGSDGRRL
jgi:multiple sugar transport system ATP-binding protein